jgi:hypothetical protein
VISYGFGYGHVRASNRAMERFGLAQVARNEAEVGPALERALQHRSDPDPSFARRPATASLILNDERRARTIPRWRRRTARAAVTAAAALGIAAWVLTTGASYSLVSHFVHMRPVTNVQTSRPEVGVLVEAPAAYVPAVASLLSGQGIHASFALGQAPSPAERPLLFSYGDQVIPQLRGGGLVRWLETGDQLHRLTSPLGVYHRHFVYASSGPSVGQWWLAHHAGGRLIAGAVKLDGKSDKLGRLHPGEVVEITVGNGSDAVGMILRLRRELDAQHLMPVPVGRLMRDAGVSV